MKKIIWTIVFVFMATMGSIAKGFDITNIWGALSDWWSAAMRPMFENGSLQNPYIIFSFIGGTIWTIIIIAPVWYLWKGTSFIIKGERTAFILRIVFIILLYLVPTILEAISKIHGVNMNAEILETVYSVFSWIVVGIALLGLWLKS